MRIIGIDPGSKGGFALMVDGKLQGAIPMPLTAGKVNYSRIGRIFYHDKPDHIFVERVHAVFGSSAKGTFSFGATFGAIQGVIIGMGLRYTLVDPKTWQKLCHEGVEKKLKPKEKSAIAAMRIFPETDFSRRGGSFHDGMVDAALIAFYGHHHLSRVDDVVSPSDVDDRGTESGITTLGDLES